MKILIATGIYPPEIGGPAGYVRGLADELVGRGHQVAVVTYGDDKTEAGRGFDVTVVPRTGGPLVRYGRYMLAVRRLARESDLVYLQGPVSEGLPGMLGSKLARKPAILKVVGDYAWEQYQQTPLPPFNKGVVGKSAESPLVKGKAELSSRGNEGGLELLDEFLTHRHGGKVWLMEAIERWVAGQARRIIVPSKYLKTVVERWGEPSEKVRVVYNSIAPLPPSVVLSEESPTNAVERSGPFSKPDPSTPYDSAQDDKKKVILTAVRAVPWKGGDFLCDCLKELPSNFILVVAGDGPCLEDWKRHATEIGVADRVRWLGRLSRAELADWYRQADVFALATGYEGFPHVVVEACSVGLPCLVSDRGGNPETKDFFPGLVTILPYRDKQAWIEAINSPLTPPLVREGGAEQSEARVSYDVLSFGRMVDETIGALDLADNRQANVQKYAHSNERQKYASQPSKIVCLDFIRQRAVLLARPGDKVLDIGGGSGMWTDILREQNITQDIYALDISDAILKERDARDICQVGDMRHLPYADQTFDTVFFMAALHHVQDTAQALAEARRVLKSGGSIVLYEPVSLKLALSGQSIKPTPDGVEFSFSRSHVLRGLAAQGFAVTYREDQGFLKRIAIKLSSNMNFLRTVMRVEAWIESVPLINRLFGFFGDYTLVIAQKK